MRIITLLLILLITLPAHAAKEADYVNAWCPAQDGIIEYVLPDRARVDCLTGEYAIEADYGPKWAESIGQSRYYAAATDRKPGILLIVGPNDWRYVERLFEAIQAGPKIRVWFTPKVE